MESAAHLDVMKVEELIDDEQYAVGVVLLERVVAMLTKMIDPLIINGSRSRPRCRSRARARPRPRCRSRPRSRPRQTYLCAHVTTS